MPRIRVNLDDLGAQKQSLAGKKLHQQIEQVTDAVALTRWGAQNGLVIQTREGTWQVIGHLNPEDREHLVRETRKYDRVFLCNQLGLGLRYY